MNLSGNRGEDFSQFLCILSNLRQQESRFFRFLPIFTNLTQSRSEDFSRFLATWNVRQEQRGFFFGLFLSDLRLNRSEDLS